ncbi:MAG: phosphatidate cytidylyltransferase [Flavobacterium sp.]
MGLYSILAIFFLIGALGIFLINRKSRSVVANLERWKKFRIYLFLVFAQLYLLKSQLYFWFALTVVLIGFYEIIKIRKSLKGVLLSMSVYAVISSLFIFFFKSDEFQWQQFAFVIVITFDGYSQIFGQLFGKTKLFPIISPGKTLEGLLGGIVSVVFTSLILADVLHIGMAKALVCGLTAASLAVAGDFLASLNKRINNVKDYSRLIPGHGGVLDRFDSLVFVGAGFYFWLKLDFLNEEVLVFCLYLFLFLILFAVAEVLYHSVKCKAETSRKMVHVFSGIACLSFPIYLKSHWSVLLLCVGFILILVLSQKLDKLPSINNIGRKSYGSWLFPVSIYLCFLCFQHFQQYNYFYLPIVILAVCDPVAALVGKRWAFGKYSIGSESKTAMGSFAFFISCLLIVLFSLGTDNLLKYIAIAAIAMITEALSKKGSDNLTIPAAVSLCLMVL